MDLSELANPPKLKPVTTKVSRLYVEDTDPDDDVHCILKNELYISTMDAAFQVEKLPRDVTKILSVMTIETPLHVRQAYLDRDISFLHLKINDLPTEDVSRLFPEALEFMSRREGASLVHCSAGVSRSASVCVGYLIDRGVADDFQSSLELIRKTRPAASPNLGFRGYIEKWIEERR